MSSHFDTGVYGPETSKLIKEAIDIAWSKVDVPPKDIELVRLLFASAIIDRVDAGVLNAETLAAHALAQLKAATAVAGSNVSMREAK